MAITWTATLKDNVSAAAKAASGALGGLGSAFRTTATGAEKLAAAKAKLAAASAAIANKAKVEANAIAGAQKAAMAAHDAAAKRVASDAAKSASAVASIENAVKTRALDAMVGRKNQGQGTHANGGSLSVTPTAPSAAAKAIQGLVKTLGPGALEAVHTFTEAFDKVAPILEKVAGPALAAGSALLALGAIGVGLAAGATKLLYGAQGFKTDVMFAFEHILKSKSGAQRAYDLAAKTSLDVGGDLKESLSSMNSLLAQGFKADFADSLLRAMADLKTLNPQANLEGIVRAVSQIKTTGHLQGDELMQLAEAGLNVQSVYEQIGKSMNLKAKPGQSVMDQVQKMQAAGKITADTAIAAVMASIKSQTGKEFGAVATEKANKTLQGAIARAENMKDQLLAGAKVDWTPISAAVQRLTKSLSSPAAKHFLDAIGTQLSRAFHMLDGISSSDLSSAFDAGARAVTALGNGIATAWKWGGYLVEIAGVIGPHWTAISAALIPVWEVFKSIITITKFQIDAISGAIRGIGSGVSGAIAPVSSLAGAFAKVAAAAQAAAGAARGIASAAGGGTVGNGVAGAAAGLFGVGGLIAARADGGPVSAGQPYLVGERGPELFRPSQNGSIVPSGDTMRMRKAGESIGRAITTNNTSISSRSLSIGSLSVGGSPDARNQASAIGNMLRGLAESGA